MYQCPLFDYLSSFVSMFEWCLGLIMFIYNTTTMSNIYSFISMFDDEGGWAVTYLRITGQIHIQACWKNLFPITSLEKGRTLTTWNYLALQKKKSSSKIPKFHRGALANRVQCLSTNKKIQKSNIIFEGSMHPPPPPSPVFRYAQIGRGK